MCRTGQLCALCNTRTAAPCTGRKLRGKSLSPQAHPETACPSLVLPHNRTLLFLYAGYTRKHPFFGAVVGRVANRIAKGKFTMDGKEYQLFLNNGPNSLHGGAKGFDKVNVGLVGSMASSTQPPGSWQRDMMSSVLTLQDFLVVTELVQLPENAAHAGMRGRQDFGVSAATKYLALPGSLVLSSGATHCSTVATLIHSDTSTPVVSRMLP